MSVLQQDIAYAVRDLRQRPGFAAVVLATLALGIGANAALFTVVNAVLLKPLPFGKVDRLVDFSHNDTYGTVSEPEFVDYQRGMSAFQSLAAYTQQISTIGAVMEPVRTNGAIVSREFFQVLGVPAEVGRVFTPGEFSHLASERVAVVSHAFWRQELGGDPRIIGHTVLIDGSPTTVVGVMPTGFNFPSAEATFWVPWRMNPDSLWARNNHYLRLVGLLAPDATLAQAIAQARTLEGRWAHDFPDVYIPSRPLIGVLTPLRDHILGATRPYLLALLGAVGFVLMIACVNVANLLLARGESRRTEFAVRTALGASAKRLARQVLTEAAVLSVGGALLGAAFAWLAGHILLRFAPSDLPRHDQIWVDYRVVLFTIAITVCTAILFGAVPAWRTARDGIAGALSEGSRSGAQAMSGQARHGLVIAEVALAVVMLSGAGLLVASLVRLRAIALGFDPSHVLVMEITLPPKSYTDTTADQAFREIVSRVERLPGVTAAALDGAPPITGNDNGWSFVTDGHVPKTVAEAPFARPEQVTADYFRTMSIPLVDGRLLTDADRMGTQPVVVINESLARLAWRGVNPLGHTLRMFTNGFAWATVVGVVGDVRARGYLRDIPATMYFPYSQSAGSAYYLPQDAELAVRVVGDPVHLASAVRAAVHAVDGRIPVSKMSTMGEVVGDSIASRVFTTLLIAGFAALALVLSGIGIYGVIAYSMSQRTREMGIRMALGASARSVMQLVIGEGARLVGIGLALGLLASAVVDRVLRSLLVGVGITDLHVMASVCLVLAIVAFCACGIPAWRATTVTPADALRAE
jgi:predicted permease